MLGGLVMGPVPGLPEVELDPDLVLVIFLPPLLYSACVLREPAGPPLRPALDLVDGDRARHRHRLRGRRRGARADRQSLINDGTALVVYRVAVGAVGDTFSLAEAGLEFVLGAAGGIAIGLAVGWVIAEIRKRLDDPPVELTISRRTSRPSARAPRACRRP